MATPITVQIHRHFVKLEAAHAREESKRKGKEVKPRPVPIPWTRAHPNALCLEHELLEWVTEYSYRLEDDDFQAYCQTRGTLSAAGVPGSRRWQFFSEHSRPKSEYLADPYFQFAAEHEGKRHQYAADEMEAGWRVIHFGRAAFQDCWELYCGTQRSEASPDASDTSGLPGAAPRPTPDRNRGRERGCLTGTFVALDVETANVDRSSICQIGVVRVVDGEIAECWGSLVDPETYFDGWNVSIHGITPEMVEGQPRLPELRARLADLVGADIVASHTGFDRVAVERAYDRYDLEAPCWSWLDTAGVARRAWRDLSESGYGLAKVAKRCGIEFRHHDATEDARAAALILVRAMEETGLDLSAWLRRVRQPIDPAAHRASRSISRDGNPDGPLFGEVVVFTGTLQSVTRAEAAQRAAALGCDVRNSVTEQTSILVVGQQGLAKLGGYTKSTKQRRAEELISQGAEITILGEDDFVGLGKRCRNGHDAQG